ncbi:MAG: hypothetical protein ACPGN3_12290 [Opitutales bacterium]
MNEKFITPSVFSQIENAFLAPAVLAWGLIFTTLLVDRFLLTFGTNVFALYAGFNREVVYLWMAGTFLLYHIEHLSGFKIIGACLGNPLRMKVERGRIKISSTFFRRTIIVNGGLSFRMVPFENPSSLIYRNSQRLLLLENGKPIAIVAEIYTRPDADRTWAKASAMLEIAYKKGLLNYAPV